MCSRGVAASAAAAACAAALLAGGCGLVGGDGGGPPHLGELLGAMPATAAERGLFYAAPVRVDGGFGTVLPLDRLAVAAGFAAGRVEAVLETGPPTTSALAGSFDAEAVARALTGAGYTRDDEVGNGWTVLVDGDASGDGALVAAPAVAVRPDVLVVGGRHDVLAAALGDAPLGDLPWVRTLVRRVDDGATAVVLSAPPEVEATGAGSTAAHALTEATADAPLERYGGFALWAVPDADGLRGALAVSFGEYGGGPDAAAAVALRAATGRYPGRPGRGPAELLDRGAPRWDDADRVVELPVRWLDEDLAAFRAIAEDGGLAFLAPSG